MKIIYISGPITNIPDSNFPEFNRVAADLRARGYEVVNPADIEQPDKSHAACMRMDIQEMLNRGADTLALLKGWETSKGARGEIAIADLLGMQIVDAYTLEPILLNVKVDIREVNRIEEIPDLTIRTYNYLKRAGIDTVTQIKSMSLQEIQSIRNIHRKSIEELEDRLKIRFKDGAEVQT